MNNRWLKELTAFFDTRSEAIEAQDITLENLCYVSGRNPRLWSDALYRDLIKSIEEQLQLEPTHTLLEVGCAAGFLGKGLAERVAHYTGVDLSPRAVKVASRLGLSHCVFKQADGARLPFEADYFDRVISYDVFTNFPDIEYASKVVSEMIRVLKPGGRVMIGSLADREKEAEMAAVVSALNERLGGERGPLHPPAIKQNLWKRIKPLLLSQERTIDPKITCYYFKRDDFEKLGERLRVQTQIYDIHPTNPYYGCRFNVVYGKQA